MTFRRLAPALPVLLFLAYQCAALLYQNWLLRDTKVYDPITNSFPDKAQALAYSHKSFVDIDLNNALLCIPDTAAACYQQLIQLQRQIAQDYPIPIPQPNVPPLISAKEAVTLYKQYVTDHAGQPVLVVFKQLYPRILLNKYGILAGHDHQQIRYFTEQLLEAHSLDFATLAAALTLLKDEVPTPQFNQWLDATSRRRAAARQRAATLNQHQQPAVSVSGS